MTQLNTIPIEMFLEKARLAVKTNQKNLNLDIKEVQALYDSLAATMTRLAGTSTQSQSSNDLETTIKVEVDGGKF